MTPSDKPRPEQEEHPDQTRKLVLSQPEDAASQTLKVPVPAVEEVPASQAPPAPSRPSSRSWTWPVVFGALAVAGAALYLVSSRGPAMPRPELQNEALEAVPPGAQAYLDQAKAGDAHAMRMLGVMYYYGLNVPQDREKGLRWYRKAAAQGSEAARAELARLEGKAAN